jgi:hypothetical protein
MSIHTCQPHCRGIFIKEIFMHTKTSGLLSCLIHFHYCLFLPVIRFQTEGVLSGGARGR